MASQGASNGPSQAAGNNQFVKFSRGAAQRIAKVVRIVEAGDRNGPGVTFDHPIPGIMFRLKVATFTGSWATGTWKTVTLNGSTETAAVYNWCNPATGDTSNTTFSRYVVFGKAMGTNSVVEIAMGSTSTCTITLGGTDLTQFPGYVAGETQLLGHAVVSTNSTCSGGLTWYSVTTCSTSTAA